MSTAERILIVEDSRSTAHAMARMVRKDLPCGIDVAYRFDEARRLVEEDGRYFLVLLDLHLPDVADDEAVDYMLGRSIPSIVVTSDLDKATRDRIASKDVVDYVGKSIESVGYLARVCRRIWRNMSVKVLVVDDSRAYRETISHILLRQRLSVLTAENGREALDILAANPDIRLILTDYDMPVMDGLEMLLEIRRRHNRESLAVIATSSIGEGHIAPRFLKCGANDFISKSSSLEELICRINMNLDMLDLVQEVRDLADKDYLTGLCNRRSFFDRGGNLYKALTGRGERIVAAMVDIDHFKGINDAWGHYVGDLALKALSRVLERLFPAPSLVARLGGEEFCILCRGTQGEDLQFRFDHIRTELAGVRVFTGLDAISFTVSIGVTDQPGGSLEDMLAIADRELYRAKGGGRNRVCLSC